MPARSTGPPPVRGISGGGAATTVVVVVAGTVVVVGGPVVVVVELDVVLVLVLVLVVVGGWHSGQSHSGCSRQVVMGFPYRRVGLVIVGAVRRFA